MLSLIGISNITQPKSPANPYNAAVTFLGIRAKRYSMMDKIQKEICRDIAKMFFCTLKPANKDIHDHQFLELISNVRPFVYIDLSGCRYLTEQSVKGLAERFPSLRRIKCFGNFRNIEVLSKNCPHLKKIDLTALQYQGLLTDRSLQALGSFQELTSLSLGSRIDYSLEALATLIEKLPKLKKYKGVASYEVLMAMAKTCKGLTDLNVFEKNEVPIMDAPFKFLAHHCRNIRSIKLDYLSKITDETLSALAIYCHNLESVKVIRCDNISEIGIIDLTEKCKHLKLVTLKDLSKINDETMHIIGPNCPNLESISMSGCNNIGNKGLIYLTDHCKKLKSINVCADITDEAVYAVNKNLDDIRRFNVSYCDISDQSMIPFAEKHTKVSQLYLRSTCITDETLFALATYCHELVEIYLQETQITEKGIEALIENCPLLRTCFIEVRREFQSPLRTKYPHIKFDNIFIL